MGLAAKAASGLIVLFLVFAAVYYVVNDTDYLTGIVPAGTYQIPATISTEFSRNFTFASSSSSGETLSFFFTPPINDTLQHSSIDIIHSSNINESMIHNQNRTYVKMQISPGRSFVNISYNVTSYGKSWQDIQNSTTTARIPSSLQVEYDHPEYFNTSRQNLEVVNPSFFRNMTLNITRNDTTVVGALRSIYDYIVQNYEYNISYNIKNVPLSAQQVYWSKQGDCEELSYLFESMSRSIGIPSWTQYGLLVQSIDGETSLGEHAWIQTFIPGNNSGTLVNIDLTVEVGGQDLGRGFLVKYPNSIVEWTDNGNSTAMVSYHTLLVAPSYGLTYSVTETQEVHTFYPSGEIVVAHENAFNLILANASEEKI